MIKGGITKTTISARVGNKMGKGQVEFTTNMEDGQVAPTGEVVEVFSKQGKEIPAGVYVGVGNVDGVLEIVTIDPAVMSFPPAPPAG